MKKKLAVQVITEFIIFATLAYFCLNLLTIRRVRKSVSKETQLEVDLMASNYQQILSEKMLAFQKQLLMYTQADTVLTGDRDKILSWWLYRNQVRAEDFEYVAFVDENGNFYADNGKRTSVTDRDYFQEIMINGKTEYVDSPVASKLTGNKIIHVCRAITHEGKNIGFFTGILPADTINSYIRGIQFGKTGFATLYSNNGTIIESSAEPEYVEKLNSNLTDEIKSSMKVKISQGVGGSHYVPAGNGLKPYYQAYRTVEHTNWVFCFQVEKSQIHELADSLRAILIQSSLVIGFALILLLAVLITRAVKPLISIKNAIGEIASGNADLSKRLEIKSKNEIGEVALSFNEFTAKLQDIMKNVKSSKESLNEAGNKLSSTSSETANAINKINSAIDVMGGVMEEQTKSVSETAGAVNEISANIDSLKNMIESQARNVSEASSAVEEMIGNINSVNTSVEKMAEAFKNLEDRTNEGIEKQEEVGNQILKIKDESVALEEANTVISSIAEQTNLLAMNAAIEAAHAGEAGKGFSVVADEIRKLSETSTSQSKMIGEQIDRIGNMIQTMVASSQESLNAFSAVTEVIKTTDALVKEITEAMTEQAAGSKQMTSALSSMNDSTLEVQTASEEMHQGNKQILEEIRQLQDSSLNLKSGMDSIMDGSKNMNSTGKKLLDLSDELDSSIQTIGSQVDKFEV